MLISRTPHHGLPELLEIFGSLIDGYSVPLKPEYINVFRQILLPLHKSKALSLFHSQLSYCLFQYIGKDSMLSQHLLTYLLKCWPVQSAKKQVLFLNEVDEAIVQVDTSIFDEISTLLVRRLCKCIASDHFQVSERALLLLNNEVLFSNISKNKQKFYPILFEVVCQNSKDHWNQTVHELANKYLILFNVTGNDED